MGKLTEKEVKEIFGVKTANLPDEQRLFIESMVGAFTDAINKSNEGSLTDAQLTEKLTQFGEQMKSAKLPELEELRKENADLLKQVKAMGENIDKLTKKGVSLNTINKFEDKLNEMFESEKFQDFASGRTRKSGQFEGFSLKDADSAPVSMTNNYDRGEDHHHLRVGDRVET